MAIITVNYSGGNGNDADGAPVVPFDFEELLTKLRRTDIDKIVVKGHPPPEAKKALAGLAEDGHVIEYLDE